MSHVLRLSVIIPTLNESVYLPKTLKGIQSTAYDDVEIIVVDTGSTDTTLTIAADGKNRVFQKPEFKGKKYEALNFGAKQSVGDILLFLDADCLVPERFDILVYEVLKDNHVIGGAFEFKMEAGGGMAYLFLERLNRLRYRFSQKYYGDQALFCLKHVFMDIGGYPAEPIMESAFLCRSLLKQGKLKLIKEPVVSSIRRFREGGFWRVLWFDIQVWIRFVMRMNTQNYAVAYWENNIRRRHASPEKIK